MARVDKFENLIAWQKARELTRGVYQATKVGTFARDFGLSRQFRERRFRSWEISPKALSATGPTSFTNICRQPRPHAPRCDRISTPPWMLDISTRVSSTI